MPLKLYKVKILKRGTQDQIQTHKKMGVRTYTNQLNSLNLNSKFGNCCSYVNNDDKSNRGWMGDQ